MQQYFKDNKSTYEITFKDLPMYLYVVKKKS